MGKLAALKVRARAAEYPLAVPAKGRAEKTKNVDGKKNKRIKKKKNIFKRKEEKGSETSGDFAHIASNFAVRKRQIKRGASVPNRGKAVARGDPSGFVENFPSLCRARRSSLVSMFEERGVEFLTISVAQEEIM